MSIKIFNGRTTEPVEVKNSLLNPEFLERLINDDKSVEQLYREVAWLYACSNWRARQISSLPRTIRNSAGEEAQTNFPFHLARLLHQSELSLVLHGSFYWMKQRNRRGEVLGVQFLHPSTIKPIFDAERGLLGFERSIGTRKMMLDIDEVVWCWLPSTDELGAGTPPGQVASLPSELLRNLDIFGAGFFERGAIPATILSVPDARRQEDIERLERGWKKMMTGMKNAWNSIALRASIEVTQVGLPISDLAMPELEEGKKNMIAAAFGISSVVIDGTAANFATAQIAKKNAIEDTITPEALLIEESINQCLLKELGLELVFNPQALSIMQEDEEQRSGSLLNLINAGLPLPVALRTLGYDLTEDDMLLIDPPAPDPMPEPEPAPDENEASRSTELAAFRRWSKKPRKRPFEWFFHTPEEVKQLTGDANGEDTPFPLAGSGTVKGLEDDNLDEREKLERRAARSIRRALAAQLAAVLPENATNQEILIAAQQIARNDAELRAAISQMLIESAQLGVTTAVTQLDAVGLGFDFALANQAAAVWATTTTNELLQLINTTSSNVVGREVARWVESGAPLPDLIRALEPSFGAQRSELIAITEATRAYAEGNRTAWQVTEQETGVTIARQWRTSNDERVCPICAPLGGLVFGQEVADPAGIDQQRRRGQETSLTGQFSHPGGRGAAAGFEGQLFDGPPAHPRCRCWTVPVIVGVDEGAL